MYVEKEDVKHFFPEFSPLIGECRFPDCAHINEPDCAVLTALEEGTIQKTRHNSYVRIYKQAAEYKAWEHNI